MNNKIQILII